MISIFSCKKENLDFLNTPDFLQNYYVDINPDYIVKCNKEVPGVGSSNWMCNGIPYRVPPNTKNVLTFKTYSSKYFDKYHVLALREEIYLGGFNLNINDFSNNLTNLAGWQNDTSLISILFTRSEDDGDVVIGSWDLDTTKKNTFKITGIDYERGIFAGTFNFYFYSKDPVEYPEHYSQRINFLNGKFTLPIPK